jgi:hypothetical protein
MLAQAETLEGLLRAHNSHNPADFDTCFAPNGWCASSHRRRWPTTRTACSEATWIEWTVTGTHAGELMGYAATHRGVEVHGCSLLRFNLKDCSQSRTCTSTRRRCCANSDSLKIGAPEHLTRAGTRNITTRNACRGIDLIRTTQRSERSVCDTISQSASQPARADPEGR